MTIRWGASLAFTLALALADGSSVRAGHCGAAKYSGECDPCSDAQVSFTSCQNGCKPSYKLVYDTVTEKRFHVCHQTVCDTVMKPVSRTSSSR